MDREWQNVLRRCRQPSFAAGLSLFLLRKIASKLYSKVIPHVWNYPPAVRAALKRIGDVGKPARPIEFGEATELSQHFRFSEGDALRLTGGHLWFDGTPFWGMTFDDPEQTVSLHRWNWLLMRLTDDPFPEVQQWGLGLMRDWIEKMAGTMTGLPWESYTVGERICNAILFMALSGNKKDCLPDLPKDLTNALVAMARFLAEHLEYNGSEWTGNHVINNARALCFAGQALRVASFTHLSVAMLCNDLLKIVNSDGFLREGSSHYHFLVTRWVLEMLWVSRITGERQVYNLVEPIAALMVRRCWFFLVFQRPMGDWVIPLVGDISPDFPWDWLIDLPWCSVAKTLYALEVLPPRPVRHGWTSLFDGKEDQASAYVFQVIERPRFQLFPESGWYRLDWGPITIFWHVEPSGAPFFRAHGHCDVGSFCLYWKGIEIMTDPGRTNYQENDPLGTYGVSARAHSSVLIDGYAPFVYWWQAWYPDFYRGGEVDVEWHEEVNSFRFSIRHTGFSRLWGDSIILNRMFRVCHNQFVIEDRIEGRSRRSIETCFQWAPGLEVLEEEGSSVFSIRIDADEFRASFWSEPMRAGEHGAEPRCKLLRGQVTPTPGGWYFPEYGEKVETSTLLLECQTTLPYGRRYVLKWSE